MAGTSLGKSGDDDEPPELEKREGDAEKKQEDDDDDGEVSDGDVDPKEVELVMAQVR
jgi:hypothetical protein